MALTVVSMLPPTPCSSPREGWLPMPMISKPPSGFTSATMAAIFEVPTSSPTISFLLSLALLMRSSRPLSRLPPALRLRLLVTQLGDAHGEAVGVAQTHVVDPPREPRERAVMNRDEAGESRFHLFAPERERHSAFEFQLPGAARRNQHLHRRLADGLQAAAEVAELDRDFPRHAFRADEYRQLPVVGGLEHFALRVDERGSGPPRERHVLLE